MASTNMTIHTPGLEGLFQALGGGFGGSASDLIQADLNRARRDQIGAETELSRADLAAKQREAQQLQALQELLLNPNVGADPTGRASLMSILAGVPDGLEHGPAFGLGATTFVNPQTFNQQDLSNAAFGTGVQTDYSKSPQGVADGLLNAMNIAQMEDAGETQRAMLPNNGTTGSRTPPLVNGPVIETLGDLITSGYGAQFPDAELDPALVQAVSSRASELYQQTRNAQLAVDMAMQEIGAKLEGAKSDGIFGIGNSPGVVRAGTPGAPATPAAAAPAPMTPPASGTMTAVNPKTGERLVLRDGAWVPF